VVNDMMITDEQVDECDGWLVGCSLVRVCPQELHHKMGSTSPTCIHVDLCPQVWTLDTSATLTKDVVPVGIGFSNGERSAEVGLGVKGRKEWICSCKRQFII